MKLLVCLCTLCTLFLFSCEKEEVGKLASRYVPPPPDSIVNLTANFKVYINIDSLNQIHVVNASSRNSVKAKWYVNGKFVSDQFSTTLPINTSSGFVNIKLVSEEENGKKDSISKNIQLHDYQIDFSTSHFFLLSTNPVTYSFYHTRYYNRYGVTGLCFGNILTDSLYKFVNGFEKTFDNTNEQVVFFYLDLPGRTFYKRMKTFNIEEYTKILNYLPGQYLFDERYLTEKNNSNTIKTDFKDSVLTLTQSNTTKFEISDTTLKHQFVGYLSSYTNATTIDIRYPSINTPEIGSYNHLFMKFPRNSLKIQAEKYSSIGTKANYQDQLNYNGRKL